MPAIPAALILYGVAVLSWRESPIAIIGLTLIFFWLIVAVTVPFLPLVDPDKPIAPFAAIGAVKANHYFVLGADFKGRDMLARALWGCQRVLVWGVTATLRRLCRGMHVRPRGRLSRRLVGSGASPSSPTSFSPSR